MPQKHNVYNLNTNQNGNISLQDFGQQAMICPVTKSRMCYFIPLDLIEGFQDNPGRSGGTQPTIVNQIFNSLITDPGGQEEPICLEWKKATQKFEIVFGCHREWAVSAASEKGFTIANHPQRGYPGIWAWVFTGSRAERTKIQMRENGNKKPQSPATKDEMVDMLVRYISEGGLDINYSSSFESLADEEKYQRAKKFMKQNTPYWGGRKFKGIWNTLTQNGNANINLTFTTFSKSKLAQFFCSNNPYGITMSDLCKKLSGSVVEKNGETYGIYFANSSAEIGGALPTNASKLRVNHKIDHMIIVAAINDSTTATVNTKRDTFTVRARWWNQKIFDAFDEIFWMPQTKVESNKHVISGTWVRQVTL